MRKLTILAGALVAFVSAHAASIDWSVANKSWTLESGAKPATGYTVYLTLASAQADLITAIKGGATSFTTSTAGVLGTAVTANSRGAVAQTTATSSSLTALSTYAYSVLAIDTTSVAGKTYYTFFESISERAYDETDAEAATYLISFGASNFANGTGWVAAVPEPTSGMLMLLGMAGLALRRKRA